MIVLDSVPSQRVNASPLIHLWSCMPSAITPFGIFQSSLLFLLWSMPVEVDFSFCISDGQKSPFLCQFFSVYLVVLVKGQDFSYRNSYTSPLLHLSRSVSTDFSVWHCSCNVRAQMLYSHVICALRSWFTSVLLCKCTQRPLVGLMKSSFVSNQVMLSNIFMDIFSPDVKFDFRVYFCLLNETFRISAQLSLWKSCCSPFAFPSNMSSLAPVYCGHLGGHPLSWKGCASWAHCRCWVHSLAGELRGWDGGRQLTEGTTVTQAS